MTKRDRIQRAINGQPCDRPPFSFWCHLPQSAKKGHEAVQSHKAFYEQTDVDFIKMMIDGYRDISQGYTVNGPDDWAGLRLPDMKSAFVLEQIEMICALHSATGGEVPLVYHMFSPYSVMRMIWGHELIRAHMEDEGARPKLLAALDRITSFQAEAAASYLEKSPAAGLMVTLSGAEQDGPGEQVFRQIVLPSDMAVLSAVEKTGKWSMLHLCGWGKRPDDVSFWKDYPADVMDYDTAEETQLPLADAKKFFTRAKAVMGGFGCGPGAVLRTGDECAVRAHTRECVKQGGHTGYIVGAGSSFPPGQVPVPLFRAVGNTLKEGVE